MTQPNAGGALATTNVRTKTMVQYIESKKTLLGQLIPRNLSKVLTPDRIVALAMSSFRKTPQLLECTPESVLGSVYECAKIGIEPDTPAQLAHLLPYWDWKTKQQLCQFQLGYQGAAMLARRAGNVSKIWARIWYENDPVFDIEEGSEPRITHKPLRRGDRGEMFGVYAVAKFCDDEHRGDTQFEFMNDEDIGKVKAFVASKSKDGKLSPYSPWVKWESRQWEKTAIKRLAKRLPLPDEIRRVMELDDHAEAGLDQKLGDIFESNGDDAKVTVTQDPEAPPPNKGPEPQPPPPEESYADFSEPDPEGHYPG